ncbi:MAG: hypothetical protein U0805_13615 [Pirellulales bacterium]
MTTVLVLARSPRRLRVEGILRWAVLVFLSTGLTAAAQERPVHWLNAGAMPPGAIGSQRLHRGGPLPGYFQPVRIRAPEGARIALATESGFANVQSNDMLVGLNIGPVYRLQVSDIPNADGLELYPTIEVVDRTYPPPRLALRYPIPIELTQDELELAANGAFVTRVIYIEDPAQALPINRKASDQLPWIEAPAGEDPLVTADRQGRPVAILRIGGRRPNANGASLTGGGGGECGPRFVMFDASQVPPRCDEAEMRAVGGEPQHVQVPAQPSNPTAPGSAGSTRTPTFRGR